MPNIFGRYFRMTNSDQSVIRGYDATIEANFRKTDMASSTNMNFTCCKIRALGSQAKSSNSGFFNLHIRVPRNRQPVGIDIRLTNGDGSVVACLKLVKL